MQNHSKRKYHIVCDHYAGLCLYSALKVQDKPRRFWRGEQEEKEFIASIEFLSDDCWKVNLPEFRNEMFSTKEEAKNYIEALIALNY